jgi:hypothetical protein
MGLRRPLLSEGDLCSHGEEEFSRNGWFLESVKLTGRQIKVDWTTTDFVVKQQVVAAVALRTLTAKVNP